MRQQLQWLLNHRMHNSICSARPEAHVFVTLVKSKRALSCCSTSRDSRHCRADGRSNPSTHNRGMVVSWCRQLNLLHCLCCKPTPARNDTNNMHNNTISGSNNSSTTAHKLWAGPTVCQSPSSRLPTNACKTPSTRSMLCPAPPAPASTWRQPSAAT